MHRLTAGALLAGLLVAAAGATAGVAVLQHPDVSVANAGEWGGSEAGEPTVMATLDVDSPLPVSLGRTAQVSYSVSLNGVELARGERAAVSLAAGDSTIHLTAPLRKGRLTQWWAAFVRANETVGVRTDPSLTVRTGPVSGSAALPARNRTMLEDATPFRSSFGSVASAVEGRYVRSVGEDDIRAEVSDRFIHDSRLDRRRNDSSTENVTVGYEVRRGWATWGEVTEERTTLRLHFLLYNPSSIVSVPVEPSGFDLALGTSERTVFDAESVTVAEEGTYARRDGTPVLEPRELREVVYVVELDNDRVADWFTGHVQRDERTTLSTALSLRYDLGASAVRLPSTGRLQNSCALQTSVLQDQETFTTCRPPLEDGPSGDGDDSGVPGGKQEALGWAGGEP